jgi:hypothetical protein
MGNGGPETCDNGIDDNDNDLIDCADPQCFTFRTCAVRAPAMSPPIMAFLAALLAAVGFLSLGLVSRKARQENR